MTKLKERPGQILTKKVDVGFISEGSRKAMNEQNLLVVKKFQSYVQA